MSKATHHDIAEAVLGMLKGGQSAKTVATSLASYLVAERRTRELDSLMRELETRRYRQDGVVEATVLSARELDDSVQETIKQLIGTGEVQLHHRLAPDIVGGVRVRALDKQLDLSIRAKLQRLKSVTASGRNN
jgi:F0F1-type ATP synthase delta subunit